MRGAGISGWRRKSKLCGQPDFVFPKRRIAVFVDGCYWHGCRKCALGAKTNTEYWKAKIASNARRDRSNTRKLKNDGWNVVRIWEHDLRASPMNAWPRSRLLSLELREVFDLKPTRPRNP
jgi:DNA mismatch endonuclease (patch repair protein)